MTGRTGLTPMHMDLIGVADNGSVGNPDPTATGGHPRVHGELIRTVS